MAGLKVVSVKVHPDGNLDLEDLRAKAEKHKDNLAAFMVSFNSRIWSEISNICCRSPIPQPLVSLKLVSRTSGYFTSLDVCSLLTRNLGMQDHP